MYRRTGVVLVILVAAGPLSSLAAKPDGSKSGRSKPEASKPTSKDAVPSDRSKEREKLAGTWQGFVVNGKGENPNAGPVKLEVTITGDKMTAKDLQAGNKSMGEGTYKLDIAKQTIDPTGTAGPEKGKTYQGIYSLEGDTLKWRPEERRVGKECRL